MCCLDEFHQNKKYFNNFLQLEAFDNWIRKEELSGKVEEPHEHEVIHGIAIESELIELDKSLNLKIVTDESAIPNFVISYSNNQEIIETTPIVTKTQSLTSILKKGNISEKSPSKKKSVNFNIPKETPQKERKILRRTLGNKFEQIISNFFSEYSRNLNSSNHLIRLTLVRVRSLDIYLRLVDAVIMLSKRGKTDGSTENASNQPKQRKQITSEEYSKRVSKKLEENRNMIMKIARSENSTEKDCSYSHNYLEKVKSTLTENGDEVLYGEFMKILTSFNIEEESVPELYYVSN